MSRLILVRHGQARAFEEHSDRLTELGILQARKVGVYLRAQGLRVDEVRTGSLERQVHTARAMGEAYGDAWPAAVVDARWNEYDALGVMRWIAPSLAESDESFGRLYAAAEENRRGSEANRHFQRMFEVVMKRWAAGELSHASVEAWDSFRGRVTAVLSEVLHCGEGRNVVVVSSGGPIAMAVQVVLEAPERQALELNWRMRNASVTEFLFSRGRVTLDFFNGVGHLGDGEITYR
jgi:broad specificity phosphatase PhoE